MRTVVRHSRGEYAVEATDVRSVLAGLGEDDFVVTDENVGAALGVSDCLAVPAGEQSKSLRVFGEVLEWLAQRAHRSSRVVALGGGVVGDLAGYAAASFMRGVRLLQVPTSLMAMVDSSVGGKVGIDLDGGKNLAGAFWPPEQVLVPLDALATLPARHFANGAAEVWKYGAILDSELFSRLESAPLAPGVETGEVVFRCVELKRGVVEEDEHETTGRRAVLNFGHTVGHAIELATGYGPVLHGEAVAIGMVCEALLGESLGETKAGTAERLRKGLASQGLPTRLPGGGSRDVLVQAMRRDKKAGRNGLAFSLVSEIGACRLVVGVPEEDVLRTLEKL